MIAFNNHLATTAFRGRTSHNGPDQIEGCASLPAPPLMKHSRSQNLLSPASSKSPHHVTKLSKPPDGESSKNIECYSYQTGPLQTRWQMDQVEMRSFECETDHGSNEQRALSKMDVRHGSMDRYRIDEPRHNLNTTARLAAELRIWTRAARWQMVVGSGVLAATFVFLMNMATLIFAYTRFSVEEYAMTVWTGECDHASNTVTGAHFIINILSSLLLAASNASMQCLGSPSRKELDAKHKSRAAFVIGVPSVRNAWLVSRPKAVVWLILGCSSLPLHLLWNSTVFQTLAARNYYAMSVTEAFNAGATWIDPLNGTSGWWEENGVWSSVTRMQHLAQNGSLERLERSACINAYGRELVADRGSVLMITNSSGVIPVGYGTANTSLIAIYASAFTPNATSASQSDPASYQWMCASGSCDLKALSTLTMHVSEPWIPGYGDFGNEVGFICGNAGTGLLSCGSQHGAHVRYCLSEPVESQCKVSLVPSFLAVVCVCNFIKIAAFLCTLRVAPKDATLVTQGDVIQSYLDAPDPTFKGICLATRRDFMTMDAESKVWVYDKVSSAWHVRSTTFSHVVDSKAMRTPGSICVRRRWGSAISAGHWFMTSTWILAFLISVFILFAFSQGLSPYESFSDYWPLARSQRLGQPLPSFREGKGGLSVPLAFFLANLPQLLLSYLYIDMNSLLSAMIGMAEWTSYYAPSTAKGLRVSTPREGSGQLSTYALNLPLRYGIPSLAVFILLHWLSSQMVFAAKIETYDANGRLNKATSLTSVYYSPLLAICFICLLATATILLLCLGLLKHYPESAPLAGNCSASIAAACQPTAEGGSFEPGLARRTLRWGVISVPRSTLDTGHATFSDGVVGKLLTNFKYS